MHLVSFACTEHVCWGPMDRRFDICRARDSTPRVDDRELGIKPPPMREGVLQRRVGASYEGCRPTSLEAPNHKPITPAFRPGTASVTADPLIGLGRVSAELRLEAI